MDPALDQLPFVSHCFRRGPPFRRASLRHMRGPLAWIGFHVCVHCGGEPPAMSGFPTCVTCGLRRGPASTTLQIGGALGLLLQEASFCIHDDVRFDRDRLPQVCVDTATQFHVVMGFQVR